MLTVQQFREDHAHLVFNRADLTDVVIDRQIQLIYSQYCFDDYPDIEAETAAGNAVCHRLTVKGAPGDCNKISALAGRIKSIGSDIESLSTNAIAMKNPSDWSSTACGGLFQKWIDTSSSGIARFGGF
jgi:hypothetical protein